MFPISIRFRIKNNSINEVESEVFIGKIVAELKKLKVDKIEFDEQEIRFKNSFFNGQNRFDLMAIIDKGTFRINQKAGELIYKFSLLRTFLIALGISSFFGLFANSLWIVLFMFSWLFGMNWIIGLIRQNFFLHRIFKMLNQK